MRKVYLVSGKRTPFAKSGSKLKSVHAMELGRHSTVETIRQSGHTPEKLGELVDEVIVGNTGCPPDAANISRVVAMRAGLPQSVPAYTVHRNCASALEAISQAFNRVAAGQSDIILAGGTESMSQMPLIYNKNAVSFFERMMKAKTAGKKFANLMRLPIGEFLKPRIGIMEGLMDPFCGLNMGQTAEVLAKEFKITRQDQDEFALASHQRAVKATEQGWFKDEIAPMPLMPKYKETIENDIGPRDGQTIEALAKLRPYFDRKNGSVTVGNACPITDGSAMTLIASEEGLAKLGNPEPLAEITGCAFAGCDPKRMGLGPVYATAKLIQKTGQQLSDFDVIELNEAFAAQVLACGKAFGSDDFCKEHLKLSQNMGQLDLRKVNPNGGAIALGHPVGATGARLVLAAAYQMKRNNLKNGLATLCIGGGQGGALSLKSVS